MDEIGTAKRGKKTIKEVRDKKVKTDDDVPGDILRLLGEDGLRILTQLINKLHETGHWPSDFTEVTMIAVKRKPKSTKCSDRHTISLITYTAKMAGRILRREKATSAVGMLRIISAGTLGTLAYEELCACFID